VPCGTHILRAICRAEDTEEKGSSNKASRLASFTSSEPSSLGDDEAFSEFRLKMASLQNLIALESSMRRHCLGHRNKLVVDGLFREALGSQKQHNTPLLHLLRVDDLKSTGIFVISSMFSFKDFLFEFLSLTVKVRLLE
jgi:hypothetical protein